MELFKLINSTWLPGTTIKTFDSLVWTERYQNAGDFQLIVEDDISILTTLPIGTLISHTDTTEVMIVENHEVERDSSQKLKATVTGRSFETFLENRITNGSLLALETAGVKNVETVTALTSAMVVTLIQQGLVSGVATVADALSNVQATANRRVADASYTQIIKRGDIYSRVVEFLQLCGYGIKVVRPVSPVTLLYFTVHDGLDKRASVVFIAQNKDLDDAKYFWSNIAYKNYANVSTKTYAHEYRQAALVADVTGLLRRRLYVEAADLEGTYAFGTTDQVVAARAQNELAGYPNISLMQATVSKSAKSKFKINYDIGDLVTVFGEFGLSQSMRVTEHILTKDSAGIQGYPTLSVP